MLPYGLDECNIAAKMYNDVEIWDHDVLVGMD
jgi:hypothetical protein